MPKQSIWGRRCSTPGCIRPREHEGDCVTDACLIGDDDEMVPPSEEAKESLLTMMRSANKEKPKMVVIEESPETDWGPAGSKASVGSDFAPVASSDDVKHGKSVRELHHTATLDLVMQGLSLDEVSWGGEGSPTKEKSEAVVETEPKTEPNSSGYSPSKTEPLAFSERAKLRQTCPSASELTKEACRQSRASTEAINDDGTTTWLDRYKAEMGTAPNSQQLIAFASNRGGNLTYKDASALLRERDRSLTLA